VGLLGASRRIILKWIIEKEDMKMESGFSWLRIASDGRLLCMVMNLLVP
jgi:hypothetical protein